MTGKLLIPDDASMVSALFASSSVRALVWLLKRMTYNRIAILWSIKSTVQSVECGDKSTSTHKVAHLVPFFLHFAEKYVPVSLINDATIPKCCQILQYSPRFAERDEFSRGKDRTWLSLGDTVSRQPLKTI